MSLHNMHMAPMLITTITRGGGVIPDSARCNGVGTGFFIPCLGEGQQKTVSTETDFAPPPPPMYFMTSPLIKNRIQNVICPAVIVIIGPEKSTF